MKSLNVNLDHHFSKFYHLLCSTPHIDLDTLKKYNIFVFLWDLCRLQWREILKMEGGDWSAWGRRRLFFYPGITYVIHSLYMINFELSYSTCNTCITGRYIYKIYAIYKMVFSFLGTYFNFLSPNIIFYCS